MGKPVQAYTLLVDGKEVTPARWGLDSFFEQRGFEPNTLDGVVSIFADMDAAHDCDVKVLDWTGKDVSHDFAMKWADVFAYPGEGFDDLPQWARDVISYDPEYWGDFAA